MSLEIYIYGLDFSKTDPTALQCKKSVQNFVRYIRGKHILKNYTQKEDRISLEKSDFIKPSRKLKKYKLEIIIS